jgi:carbamoyl-phosphate synthase small subunit
MSVWTPPTKTALLITDSGEIFYGHGIGATGHTVGEVCFNTAMTGYQEILTDPSYASQIVTFTFPHIGNVGTNDDDSEISNNQNPRAANGLIIREAITAPANYRNTAHLNDWLIEKDLIGISGVDTRAITAHIRDNGMFNALLTHAPDGNFDIAALEADLAAFAGLEGADLAGQVTSADDYDWGRRPLGMGRGL